MDQGLAANQLVYDNVVPDEQHAPEIPARHFRLAFEVQPIRPEIPVPDALDDSLVDLEALAGGFCTDAILYPGIKVLRIDRGAREKSAQHIRIIQDGDVRGGLDV